MSRVATTDVHAAHAASWPARIGVALSDIKVAHSVFALPFAILAACMAFDASGAAGATFAGELTLVVVCMVLARTWAMLVNRIADRRFDRDNERTARRAIAAERIAVRDAMIVAFACAALFLIACAGFLVAFANPWPLILGAPVLAWIALYSFTKRFTALCHLFLGGALACSPLAAVIAVHPPALFDPTGGAVALIAAFVLFWVAGFDVAYALQDLDFDRRVGLRSIPARLGWRRALWAARVMHVIAFAALAAAWFVEPRFDSLAAIAIAMVGGLLLHEHIILHRRGLAGIPMAFFTVNGVVSVALGLLASVDVFT